MDKVAIIGAGNLGSRHLQALALIQRPIEVMVIDPSDKSLEIAHNRWNEMDINPLVSKCVFTTEMEELPEELDVVIVATSSKPRRSVVEQLLSTSKVKYLILEKVLFQKLEDYQVIGNLLKENHVSAWVNCPRRNTNFYKKLKDSLKQEKRISMYLSGSNWGMGCNSIHMLDTYAFITGEKDFKANSFYLDDEIIDSKRKGYIEFTGELRIESSKGLLTLISYSTGDRPVSIVIDSEKFHVDIDEMNKSARFLNKRDGSWNWETDVVDIRPQSRVTHELVQDLLESGNCGLTTFAESMNLHKVLIGAFIDHLSKNKKERCNICPIT